MKRISAALKAHLAQPYQTMCTCLQATLPGGSVLGFTDHDADITVSGWLAPDNVLNGTYQAATGYNLAEIATNSALSVDNTEVKGILQSPAIIEADLLAGKWDLTAVRIFQVNWADITMGPLWLRMGNMGEIGVERGLFRAELRGLMQAFTNTIGEVLQPGCRATLGDARCTVNLVPLTVTSTLTGVNADGVTLYDTARNEAGPAAGTAITGVTNANPGVVTLAAPLTLANGAPISISGIVGPAQLNADTLYRNPSGSTFQLGIDTTDTSVYPPYVSGGVVIPLGTGSGYFDGGKITFTSGLNAGISMEIKAYVPGQLTLAMPMPYACAFGDGYTLTPGCDKAFDTCKTKFNNVLNNRSEPYLPGVDKIVQVGK